MKVSGLVAVFCLTAAAVPAGPTFEEINAACGQPLFSDGNLWDDEAEVVARRLRLPQESLTSSQSSFRLYPSPDARFFGARPYSQSLIADGERPSALSLVFSNKGDAFEGESGPSESLTVSARRADLRENREAIEADAEVLTATLTGLFGEPTPGQLGDGRETREKVLRWDWQGHAFLLAAPREEYAALRIIPTGVADGDGPSRVPDAVLKERLAARVEHRPNGDVVLRDMPMVDQGPKGYCVPATWERVMRYMGIPADMYVLAMAGGTKAGGGTSTDDLVWAVKGTVTGAGRRMESPRVKLTANGVAKFVDKGLPVMWAMFSTKEFNAATDVRVEGRQTMTDPAAWGESLADARDAAKDWPRDICLGHVCMIIGYNPRSGEIAISDSWGPEFVERWVTEEEAQAVSQDRFYLIRP